jgi:hypothetical protein
MHPLIEMANHLIATALAGAGEGGALRVRSCALDEGGLRLSAWVDHPSAAGEVRIVLRVDPPQGDRGLQQTVRLVVEQWPDRLPAALEPLRRVLQKATLKLELDFRP